jgi:hypothetical protein
MTTTHIEHAFKMTAHMDGCHWYSTTGRCECGAILRQYGERDVREDPWSAVWMDDEDAEDRCERCRELLAGAAPEPFTSEVLTP